MSPKCVQKIIQISILPSVFNFDSCLMKKISTNCVFYRLVKSKSLLNLMASALKIIPVHHLRMCYKSDTKICRKIGLKYGTFSRIKSNSRVHFSVSVINLYVPIVS